MFAVIVEPYQRSAAKAIIVRTGLPDGALFADRQQTAHPAPPEWPPSAQIGRGFLPPFLSGPRPRQWLRLKRRTHHG
jgi:hypothetical protein